MKNLREKVLLNISGAYCTSLQAFVITRNILINLKLMQDYEVGVRRKERREGRVRETPNEVRNRYLARWQEEWSTV